MGMNKNIAASLEIRVADFDKKVSKVSSRMEAEKLFKQEAGDMRKQFIEEKKLDSELYDQFLTPCNRLNDKIQGMGNIA